MPSASSSSTVAGRPLAPSTTSAPMTHVESFHRSTTAFPALSPYLPLAVGGAIPAVHGPQADSHRASSKQRATQTGGSFSRERSDRAMPCVRRHDTFPGDAREHLATLLHEFTGSLNHRRARLAAGLRFAQEVCVVATLLARRHAARCSAVRAGAVSALSIIPPPRAHTRPTSSALCRAFVPIIAAAMRCSRHCLNKRSSAVVLPCWTTGRAF
jgi:hypothetical protein